MTAVPRDMAAAVEVARDLARQRDELRELLAEVLDMMTPALPLASPEAMAQIAEWRNRAGLDA